MLREMTARQYMEWRAYFELEPFDEMRADLRNAHLVQTVLNVLGGKAKLADCLLPFGEDAQPEPKAKRWQDIKAVGLLWAEAINSRDKSKDTDPEPPARRSPRPKDPPSMSAAPSTPPRRTKADR